MPERFNGLTAYPSTRLIQRSPEIPGRNGAIRPPFFSVLHQLFRRGQFSFAKSPGETLLHPVISYWPDVRPAKIKQQQHFDSPPANTAHLGKTRDDFVVTHSEKRTPGRNRAIDRLPCEIFYCRSLCARKTSAAKFFIWCSENFCGVEPFCFWVK